MTTYADLFAGRNLTKAVQGTKSGLPIRVPAPFVTPSRGVRGNTVEYYQVNGTRKVARAVHYGSPSKRRGLTGVTKRSATLVHSHENVQFPANLMVNVKNINSDQIDPMAQSEVARQTKEFKQLFVNLRVAAVQMAIANGRIGFDSDGNLVADTSYSSAEIQVDFGIPAANRGNITGTSGTLLGGAAAKWSAAATDIVKHARQIKQLSLKDTGYLPAYAFYGANVPQYLADNTSISTWIKSQAPLATAANQQMLASGEIARGLLGFDWVPMSDAYFLDQDGTAQSVIDDNTVVFAPAVSEEWYELVEGSFLIPNGMGLGQVAGDMNAMLANISEVTGMFGYATMSHDPVSIQQNAGDTFVPLIKVPGAIYIAKVHW